MIKSLLLPLIGALLLSSYVFAEGTGTCNYGGCTQGKYAREDSSSSPYASGYNCVATINITYIPGTAHFEVIDGFNQEVVDYQVTVTNTGSCVIYGAQIQITVPGGANIIRTKNLNKDTTATQPNTYDLVTASYGVAPGSIYTNVSFSASFVSSGYAFTFDATIVPQCPRSCLATPTTSTNCTAKTDISLRAGSSGYNSTSGNYYATYDVLIVNVGGCGILEVGLDISQPSGVTFTSAVGLTPAPGGFKVTAFRNTQGILQGDRLPIENHYWASFTAEFSGRQALNKFIVDTTSFCSGACDSPLSTTAYPYLTAGAQCTAVAAATYIPGSQRNVQNSQGGSALAVDYQVFFANYGYCNVDSILIAFSPYSGSTQGASSYLTPNGGDTYTVQKEALANLTAPGGTSSKTTVTVVFSSSGYARELPINNFQVECGSICVANNYASDPDRTTTAPTSSAIVTPPTSPASNGGCAVTATATVRSTWKSGSTENRLYDFAVINTGSSVAQSVDISLAFSTASQITQSWNVAQTSATTLRANLFSVAPGGKFTGSGYVLTIDESVFSNGFTDPVVTVTATQC